MEESGKVSRKRQPYTAEFKTEAIKLVLGLKKAEVARRLGVTATTLSAWIKDLAPEGKLVDQELRAEVKRLAEENRQLKMERVILKKSDGLLHESKLMRYGFIQDYLEVWPVRTMCRVLRVSSSGFYTWRRRPMSAMAQRRRDLAERAWYNRRRLHSSWDT